jgi:hypothetical protein
MIMSQETLKDQLTAVVAEQTHSVIAMLTVEQQAALEAKLLALPIEVRSSLAAKYPTLSNVEAYIIRQMVREANGRLASNKRPVWYSILKTNADSLRSSNKDVATWAETQLRNLAEEIDTKESINLLKKYKVSQDTNSKDAHIVKLCGIFGVSPANLA